MADEEGFDVALKLLHTADWHLGRRFRSVPRESELRLTRARLEVVGRILDLAEHRGVDAVLCAGDLFDEPAPEQEWWQGLLQQLTRRTWERPLFLCPGNHDPLTPASPYDPSHPFRKGLPDYVHVVDRDDYRYELSDDAVLYSVPCRSRAGQSDLVDHIPVRGPGDDRIRVGLVHGQTFDIGGQTPFPIPRTAAVDRGLDYLAVGDTHSFREVDRDAPVPTVYPSAPEPTNFGEKDAGYVALVFFPRDRRRRAVVEKHPVAEWTWREQTCRSIADLRQLRSDEGLRKCVLRLHVDMKVPLAEYDEAGQILKKLGGSLSANPRVGILLVERSRLRLDARGRHDFPDDMPPVLHSAVQRLRSKASGESEEAEKAERALHHLFKLVRGGSR